MWAIPGLSDSYLPRLCALPVVRLRRMYPRRVKMSNNPLPATQVAGSGCDERVIAA